MTTIWVVLNEAKTEIVEVIETESPDSKPLWPQLFKYKAGCVFCRKKHEPIRQMMGLPAQHSKTHTWYVNLWYWEDTSRWGYGTPSGMTWSACLALPAPLKMVEIIA